MDFAEFLKGLAAVAWPAFAFAVLLTFKDEIKDLLARLKKGKLLGQEIELAERLDKFQETVSEAEAVSTPLIEIRPNVLPPDPANADLEASILLEATRSPRVSLMLLAAEVEQTIRKIFLQTGWHRNRKSLPFTIAVGELPLPEDSLGSVRMFWEIRNQIIHGHGSVSDEEILRAIDSGLVLLRSLKAIPVEAHIVYQPGVAIYTDPECRELAPGKGIILETRSPRGVTGHLQIFPTLKTDYEKGKMVSWEWDLTNVWGKTWYKDPSTGEIKIAWDSAGEFCGKYID